MNAHKAARTHATKVADIAQGIAFEIEARGGWTTPRQVAELTARAKEARRHLDQLGALLDQAACDMPDIDLAREPHG